MPLLHDRKAEAKPCLACNWTAALPRQTATMALFGCKLCPFLHDFIHIHAYSQSSPPTTLVVLISEGRKRKIPLVERALQDAAENDVCLQPLAVGRKARLQTSPSPAACEMPFKAGDVQGAENMVAPFLGSGLLDVA
jgi:hypothetical protein